MLARCETSKPHSHHPEPSDPRNTLSKRRCWVSPQVVPGRALELEREQGYEGKRQDIIKEFPVRPKKALATRSRFWLLILSEGCTFECLAELAHPFGSVVRGHDDGRQSRRCCWQRWWDRSAGRVASAIRPRLVEQPAFAIRFVGGCCCGRRRWGINSFLRPPRWCVRRFRSACRDNLESTKALSKYQPPFHNAPSPFRQDASERSGI